MDKITAVIEEWSTRAGDFYLRRQQYYNINDHGDPRTKTKSEVTLNRLTST